MMFSRPIWALRIRDTTIIRYDLLEWLPLSQTVPPLVGPWWPELDGIGALAFGGFVSIHAGSLDGVDLPNPDPFAKGVGGLGGWTGIWAMEVSFLKRDQSSNTGEIPQFAEYDFFSIIWVDRS